MLAIIAAISKNRVIGINGKISWRLPEDVAYFKRMTMGKPVIMGRKTWESIPVTVRPLPGRQNIVVTRNKDYVATGANVVTSIEEALSITDNTVDQFVIGGSELYRLALPVADMLFLTEIDAEFKGDTFFPEINYEEWIKHPSYSKMESNGLTFSFAVYDRRKD